MHEKQRYTKQRRNATISVETKCRHFVTHLQFLDGLPQSTDLHRRVCERLVRVVAVVALLTARCQLGGVLALHKILQKRRKSTRGLLLACKA